MEVISDPWFYAAAVPAVFLFGISKGGFGGGLGVAAVPLIALVISPVQAAAILLPILCLMDLFSLWAFRGKWVVSEIRLLVPAALVGIAVGTLMFDTMSTGVLRLLLGTVAVTFTLHHWITRLTASSVKNTYSRRVGAVAAAIAGFTSFIAHAGGPPLSMYLLRRNLDKTRFAGTTVFFFMAVNYVKLIPYGWLGQFDVSNLGTSLVLSPLAPLGVFTGVWLHKRISDQFFFLIVYGLLFIIGLRLMVDGVLEIIQ